MRLPPRVSAADLIARLREEVERVEREERARARTLLAEWDFCERAVRTAVARSPRIGGVRLCAGAVPYSYRYPARTTRAVVAWAWGRVLVQVERAPAPKHGYGGGAYEEYLSRTVALELVCPELARELAERRTRRQAHGLVLPPFGSWRVVRRWAKLPVAVLARTDPHYVTEPSTALATPLGAWTARVHRRPSEWTLRQALETLAQASGIDAATWERWLRGEASREEIEHELALAALARGA